VLRYETCGGLFNQHYCQLAGLTMAAAIGAHAVFMPPALARDRSATSSHYTLVPKPYPYPNLTLNLNAGSLTLPQPSPRTSLAPNPNPKPNPNSNL